MPDSTRIDNFSVPQYSEDHPKFGANAAKVAPVLQKPDQAFTKQPAEDGSNNEWASNLGAAFVAKRAINQGFTLPPESREFIARRALRQDSSATLVDFSRRPSSSKPSKFQLEVVPAPSQGTAPTEQPSKGSKLDSEDQTFENFNWRPSLNPLQPAEGDFSPHGRQDSDATLVNIPAPSRRGSRSGSLVREMWRERLNSNASLLDERRGSSFKRRQSSFSGMMTPTVPEEPELAQFEQLVITKPTDIRPIDIEIQPLKGLARTPSISEDDDEKNVEPLAEVRVMTPEAVPEVQPAHNEPEAVLIDPFTDKAYPVIADPVDPARILTRKDLISQRTVFSGAIFSVNAALLIVALAAPAYSSGIWVLAFICFIKAKDCAASVVACLYVSFMGIYRIFRPLPEVESKWILSCIPAYSESEEQIVKTVFSLRDNGVEPHKQLMAIFLDGKTRDVKQHMRITRSFKREYVTSKFKRNHLIINAGFMEDVPVICFEKVKNAGKKDSLILCHDLFNVMRENAPMYTKLLRQEIEEEVMPSLVGADFPGFDMVFCTDADSVIHKGAVKDLADAIARDSKAIAACGLVLVELEKGAEWSFWNLYQQFQYNFGQFVRRQAESVWGKVTCLPGCITMIAVRPEMAGAMRKYAEPITAYPVLLHQVQYLGTDRRLTYSMLSQSTDLHTLFVPSSVSETVAPQSLKHYLSQRRRWGSNAYFNNYFYCFGENMIWITRLWASIELLRLSVVYYRIANTALFIYGLTRAFSIIKIAPLLVVSQLPTVWFLANLFIHKALRERSGKILIGLLINKFMGPVMSVTIFTNVVRNLGSQAWGMTGGSNATAAPAAVEPASANEKAPIIEKSTNEKSADSRSMTSSIDELAAAEANIGVVGFTPEEMGETVSEVNEIDREDPRSRISPIMDGL